MSKKIKVQQLFVHTAAALVAANDIKFREENNVPEKYVISKIKIIRTGFKTKTNESVDGYFLQALAIFTYKRK